MAAQEFGPESAGARRRVVGGCSAGSLATQLWARVLQEQYGFHQLLLDSFVGYFPAYARAFFPTAYGACSAGQQEAMWDDEFVEVCKAGGADIVEFTKETLRMYPDLEASYIGFTEDIIQKAFYVIGAGDPLPTAAHHCAQLSCIIPPTFHVGRLSGQARHFKRSMTSALRCRELHQQDGLH